ncbi:MAG: hypothetical protein KBS80_03535 [Bacteroidales bacterium]|nr:hypothetical protein [Candidatus Cryptobacteroides choladohippi]
MKKIIAIAAALVAFASVAVAQPRAIGARLTYGAELSYQHGLGSNFAEFDLGMALGNHSGFTVSGIYDFLFPIENGFNFFVGPGAQFSAYTFKEAEQKVGLGIGGNVGIEYQFSGIPFNISVDYRPMWNFVGYSNWSSAALSFRYRF